MLFKRFESRVRSQFIKLIVEEGSSTNKLAKYEGPTENDLVTSCIEEMVFNACESVLEEALLHQLDLRTASYKIALERIYSYYDAKKLI
jgi:glutamate dehydrogenase/leucine dehydrogenase